MKISLADSALRGRIALPVIKYVSRKMRDTASETLALPDEEAVFLPNNQSLITYNSSPSLREDDIGVGAVAEELWEEFEEEGVGFLDEA